MTHLHKRGITAEKREMLCSALASNLEGKWERENEMEVVT